MPSTVDVVAAKIEPKLASTLIRQLCQVCPLENLRHVKRVRRRTECDGRSELSIILCLSTGSETCSEELPEDVQKIVDTYQLSPFTAKVARCSATSKEEWEEQCKLWPTSYHPAHDLDVVRGFQEEELPSIFKYMKTAIQLSKVGNAAIIVDPSSKQIIAKATDQTLQPDTSEEGKKFAEVKAKDTCSLNESTEKYGDSFLSSTCPSKCNRLNMEVSCINPWGWTKQRTTGQKPLPCEGCFAWHPLRHAAIVAIENAAERDIVLFPSSTTTTKPNSNGNLVNYSDNEPAKRLKKDTKDKEQSTDGASCGDLSETTRPYLCTGYGIYLVWEPCAMCAMALVHQRFKRVFYAFPNPVTGALGGVYRLHREKSLNHHYTVFRISVPEAYLNGSTRRPPLPRSPPSTAASFEQHNSLGVLEWELIEVHGNPPPCLQDSTVDVVAAKIEPKLANALVRQLTQVCPLENLRHVKRVRRRTVSEGKSELSIILCLSTGSETCSKEFPEDVQKIVDTYQLSPFTTKVAKYSATSKEEWEEQCKLWPTSYHPAHDLVIVRGFRDEELPSIFNFMKTAIQSSKAGNAAIIVDPSHMQIISKAVDLTLQYDTAEQGYKFAEAHADDTVPLNGSTENDGNFLQPRSFHCECNSLNMNVSCLNPWGWMKQSTTGQNPLPCEGCYVWNPLRHAAMVAIENVAERDRMLFPSSTSIMKPDSNGNLDNGSDNEPAKRLKMDTKDKEDACCGDLSETTRSYLCTGFDIYLVWEPCTMCAMALVHQRFKRVFYAFPNPIAGALGGIYRLHGEKSLNHHYTVFRISVPESYLNSSSEC